MKCFRLLFYFIRQPLNVPVKREKAINHWNIGKKYAPIFFANEMRSAGLEFDDDLCVAFEEFREVEKP